MLDVTRGSVGNFILVRHISTLGEERRVSVGTDRGFVEDRRYQSMNERRSLEEDRWEERRRSLEKDRRSQVKERKTSE